MRISHIPVIGAKVPFSLNSTHSTHNVARTAALQAISGHDVAVYGSDDSPIIKEAAELAERYGKTIHRSGDVLHIKDGGSLTLRSIERTIVPDRTSGPVAMRADKPLYDLAIADEKKKPSDILAVHTVWYSRYLKDAGLSNVLIHAHMNAEPFANLQGEGLEVARELECDIENGQLVPSQPTIALTRASAQGWRDAGADVIGFVNHGIDIPPIEEVKEHSSGFLLSLGRISPEKKVDKAIEAAKRSGKPLIIAGTIALEGDDQIVAAQEKYYNEQIKPHITEFADTLSPEELQERIQQLAEHKGSYGNNPPIIYVGKAVGEVKSSLYQNAAATFFLADPEAFGLPQIESLAYGTPVITYSVDNIIENGITGFEVRSVEEAVKAVGKIDRIDRLKARHRFEDRFSVRDEVQEIEWIYNRVFIDQFLKEFQSDIGLLKHPETDREKEKFRTFTQICRDSNRMPPSYTARIYRAYTHMMARIKENTAGLIADSAKVFTQMTDEERNAVIYAAVKGYEFEDDELLRERMNNVLQRIRDPLAMESVLNEYKEYLNAEADIDSRVTLPKAYRTSEALLDRAILRAQKAARETQEPQILLFDDKYFVVGPDLNPERFTRHFQAANITERVAFYNSPESQLTRRICAELPRAIEKGEQAVVEWIGKLTGLEGDYDPFELAETLASAGYKYGYPIDNPETETDPSEYAKWLIGRIMQDLWQGATVFHRTSKWVKRYQELARNDRQDEKSWVAAVRNGGQESNRKTPGPKL